MTNIEALVYLINEWLSLDKEDPVEDGTSLGYSGIQGEDGIV
jgi:hypothetical protein